jgi:hypothetical protein
MSAVEKLAKGVVPDYRPLKAGEIIRSGDEVWAVPKYRGRGRPEHATWIPVYDNLVGGPHFVHANIRRPIAPVTGRDLCE